MTQRLTLDGEKRPSLGFCILFFPMFALVVLQLFSSTNIMIHYGPNWYIAWAAWMILLAASAWSMRDTLHAQFFPQNNATQTKIVVTTLFGVLGFAALAAGAVFGGVPALAHRFTAHPGELMVTVIGKEATYQRFSCRPRLIIAEFTYFSHNYICASNRAFSEIGVGSTLRLQGQISPYGISIERFFWKTNQ